MQYISGISSDFVTAMFSFSKLLFINVSIHDLFEASHSTILKKEPCKSQ